MGNIDLNSRYKMLQKNYEWPGIFLHVITAVHEIIWSMHVSKLKFHQNKNCYQIIWSMHVSKLKFHQNKICYHFSFEFFRMKRLISCKRSWYLHLAFSEGTYYYIRPNKNTIAVFPAHRVTNQNSKIPQIYVTWYVTS